MYEVLTTQLRVPLIEHFFSPTLSQLGMLSLQTGASGPLAAAGAMTTRRAIRAMERKFVNFIVVFLMIGEPWSL